MTRRLDILTTSRADFGIYLPVVRELASRGLDVGWVVSGTHLSSHHGYTRDLVAAQGLPIRAEIPIFDAAETTSATTSASMGAAMQGMAAYLEEHTPSMLLALGDRFEMFSLVAATLPFRVPVLHIHGGEITAGAIDDSFRHALTKLSHLHCVSTEAYAQRVRQLGEEPWRVLVSGAPALDSILSGDASQDLQVHVGNFSCEQDFVLVAYHPETLSLASSAAGFDAMLEVLQSLGLPLLFTGPNADEEGDAFRQKMKAYVARDPSSHFVENLGIPRFYNVMQRAKLMIGNSSSGIIEAPSFGLPVVNIGGRQDGRTRGTNVVEAEPNRDAIEAAVTQALQPEFVKTARAGSNPYGDGNAAARIADFVQAHMDTDRLIRKAFVDMDAP